MNPSTSNSPFSEIQDIVGPIHPGEFPMVWVIVLAALLLAGMLVWFFIRRRARRPGPDARARALAALQVAAGKLEQTDSYHAGILFSDILRGYLQEIYHLRVTAKTTPEFMAETRERPEFSNVVRELLRDFLGRCDMAKFARADATAEEKRRMLQLAEQIVQEGAA